MMHLVLSTALASAALLQTGSDQAGPDPIDAHSAHGAAFDVGPRQAAYLMENPDRIDFPVTFGPSADAQRLETFFHQGVGQLHGFWYLEAERTFRQILAEDPECTMAYWGMAMANVDQPDRAAWFARSAWLGRGLVTKRERQYIDMMARYHGVDGPDEPKDLVEPRNPLPGEEDDGEEEERREPPSKSDCERLVKDYEELVWDYPNDVEAKAFLANRIWLNRRKGIQTTSRMAVESLLQEVFDHEPLHPAHHYRIHLWDAKDSAKRVVDSAVNAGLSWPNVAHQWHMGGHIFARLGRHFDAAWQQEASARVDHAHMQKDWVLPDQIHNFAHNNEWLTRSLRHQGRVTESVELAKNTIELPRHPAYNMLEKRGTSSVYGRLRLIETLALFEDWDELRRLGGTMYLEPHVTDAEGAERAYAMGRAAAHLGDSDGVATAVAELELMVEALKDERAEAVDEAEEKALAANKKSDEMREAMTGALKSFERDLDRMRDRVESLGALETVLSSDDVEARGDALETLKKHRYERTHLSRLRLEYALGLEDKKDRKKALDAAAKEARDAAKNRDGQLYEHANMAYVLWEVAALKDDDDLREEALEVFEDLREGASFAELERPVFQRLAPLVEAAGHAADWRPEFELAEDVGERLALESLGPKYWTAPETPDFALADAFGNVHRLSEYRGRPVLVVFFLGFGCVHCVEQLQAIAPEVERFEELGIEILAIGLQTPEELQGSIGDDPNDTGYPFPVLADPSLDQFRAWRAYDDFEDIALHGTYLIDPAGRLRWFDIGHLPFMEVDFLVDECQRLLELPARGDGGAPIAVSDAAPAADVAVAVEVEAPDLDGASEPEVPAGAQLVAFQLDTAPHCANCVADIQRICGKLDGFVSVAAVPGEKEIRVVLDPKRLAAGDVSAALTREGRPATALAEGDAH